ncbi:hypothetical protein [Bdellovibrio sp. HCB274]|uniref:hypothetical protein n=1 Tax=Bdellovibrio sp. HCB274 TaxID=3394361 RepID=UPI0039B37CBA
MKTALLIVDMMNTFDFPNPAPLLRSAVPVAANIQRLKKRAQAKRIPIILRE